MGGSPFSEVDRAEWFDLDRARAKLQVGQHPFLDRIADALSVVDHRCGGVVPAGDINT